MKKIITVFALLTLGLVSCEKEPNCKTWSCETQDSYGKIKKIEVFGPNHQLYTNCHCVSHYKQN
jgi:hypothetical protein